MSESPSNRASLDLEQTFKPEDISLARSFLAELQDALETSVFTVCLLAIQSAPPDQKLDVLAFCHELREMPKGERLGVARALGLLAEAYRDY